jgi:hypothetical protein
LTASYPDLIPLLLLLAVVPVLLLRTRRRTSLPHRIALAVGAGIWRCGSRWPARADHRIDVQTVKRS